MAERDRAAISIGGESAAGSAAAASGTNIGGGAVKLRSPEVQELMEPWLREQEWMWLRERAGEWAEADVLPEDVIVWMHRKGFFKLFVPAAFGGRAVSLTEAIQLYEALAQADGSVAWLVQIGAGGGFFVPSFEPAIAAELFGPEQAVLAGSGAIGGYARRVTGGYRVSGRWRYASGAQYATFFTANARIEGSDAIRAFVFLPHQVRLERDWRALGMRATSTWSFAVEDEFVPEELSFVVGQKRWEPGLGVYEVPFGLFATASIGAVAIGLAEACLWELDNAGRFSGKGQVRQWWQRWGYAHQLFHSIVAQVEKDAEVGRLGPVQARRAEWLLQEAVQVVRRLLLELLPLAGMCAVVEGETLGRFVRDFLTVCQHRALWSWQWGMLSWGQEQDLVDSSAC